jgi:peroxiredoxin family protein
MTQPPGTAPDKLSLVVFSGDFARVHYALVLAAGAIASNTPVTLFFTMEASRALMNEADGSPSWRQLPGAEEDEQFAKRGVGRFEELLLACVALGVKFMVCEMGLKARDLDSARLRHEIPITSGGVVTYLADASKHGAMMFI